MNKELDKIKNAAKSHAGFGINVNPDDVDERYYRESDCQKYDAFLFGAISDEAKAYHTKNTFTEQDMIEFGGYAFQIFGGYAFQMANNKFNPTKTFKELFNLWFDFKNKK